MLGDPGATPYDVRFSLLGVPVRIHPLFWVITLLLGFRQDDPGHTVLWVGCVFVSIMVHEFGHALVSKTFRGNPAVVLYSMGGLCISPTLGNDPRKRLPVIAAGPLAGLALAALVLAAGFLIWGVTPFDAFLLVGIGNFRPSEALISLFEQTPRLGEAYSILVFFNLIWTVVNMCPVYPLDGGQFLERSLALRDHRHSLYRTLPVSMIAAGLLAFFLFQREQPYAAVFFIFIAFQNFQLMQAIRDGYGGDYSG
jgi:Zn-dependent protease